MQCVLDAYMTAHDFDPCVSSCSCIVCVRALRVLKLELSVLLSESLMCIVTNSVARQDQVKVHIQHTRHSPVR